MFGFKKKYCTLTAALKYTLIKYAFVIKHIPFKMKNR